MRTFLKERRASNNLICLVYSTGQPQDLDDLAKHLNDLGGSDTPSSAKPGSASGPVSQRKPVPPAPLDESDDEDQGPMRDDGTLHASDISPL